ncbi:hypothetical protein HYPSUDRAFT_204963 [Hypholoma sublateritium FD-334 SS-4]|uniref:Uncharacterized protein n=1 Tax=Hypholoma sublateritium (strain FD-334 SS-4) TaxID=945553 RepID=A0A0D2NJI0_HYPSF|nr:hypothetical protein HYPSUDRAFT_204963 [Hypholoma sublateritium FD-334 SS-4]
MREIEKLCSQLDRRRNMPPQRNLSRILKLNTKAISRQDSHPSQRASLAMFWAHRQCLPGPPSTHRSFLVNLMETKSDSGKWGYVDWALSRLLRGQQDSAGKRHKTHSCINWCPRGYYVHGKADSSAGRIGDGGTPRWLWMRWTQCGATSTSCRLQHRQR